MIKTTSPRNRRALAGLALELPALLFWAAVLLSLATGRQALAEPALALVAKQPLLLVAGVLLLLPLAGGVLGILGFRGNRLAGSFAILLGLGMAGINLLFQSAPPPA